MEYRAREGNESARMISKDDEGQRGSESLDGSSQTSPHGVHVVTTSRSKGAGSDAKFIQCTYLMLEDCSHEFPEIISWTREGDGIEVKDVGALEITILPRYFNSNKYSSMVRQLNKYDFTRRKPEPVSRNGLPSDAQASSVLDIFQHEFFRRGRKDLLVKIKRKEIQVKAARLDLEEEIQRLKAKVQDLEEGQSEMAVRIEKLEDPSFLEEEKAPSSSSSSKQDEIIRRLEHRLRSVEGCLWTLMKQQQQRNEPPRQHHHHHSSSWPAASSLYDLAPPESLLGDDHGSTRDSPYPGLRRYPSQRSLPPVDRELVDDHGMNDMVITKPASIRMALPRQDTFDTKISRLDLDLARMDED